MGAAAAPAQMTPWVARIESQEVVDLSLMFDMPVILIVSLFL
jgi:hypothetical protein